MRGSEDNVAEGGMDDGFEMALSDTSYAQISWRWLSTMNSCCSSGEKASPLGCSSGSFKIATGGPPGTTR